MPLVCCDRVCARAEQVAADTGAHVCRDAEELLAAHPDIVVVAVGIEERASITRRALRAEAGVVLEEPFAACLSDADSLLSLAEQKRRPLALCRPLLYLPSVRALAHAIQGGTLAAPYHAAAQVQTPDLSCGWENGGLLLREGTRMIGLLSTLLGPVREVGCLLANTAHPALMTEDSAAVILRFSGGATATLSVSLSAAPGSMTLTVSGTGGSISLGGRCPEEMLLPRQAEISQSVEKSDALAQTYRAFYRETLSEIEQARGALSGALAGRDALAAALACYKSAVTRRLVSPK